MATIFDCCDCCDALMTDAEKAAGVRYGQNLCDGCAAEYEAVNGPSVPVVTDAELETACRAMWASWGRMRPGHERKHRADMRRTLEAAARFRAGGGR